MSMPTLKKGSNPLCFRCGSTHSRNDYCRANEKTCFTCQGRGHLNTQCHHFQLENNTNTTTDNTRLMDNLKKTVEKFKDVMRCAICLDVGSADKIQCVRGHLICATCKDIQDKCPTCRNRFSREKPSIVVRQIMETLVNVCRHKNCYNILEDDHEDYCRFKETDCKFRDCNWNGPVFGLVKHVTEMHPEQEIVGNGSKMIWAKDNIYKDNEYSGLSTLHYFEGHVIWDYSDNLSHLDELLMRFCFIPNGKPKSDINVEITFKSLSREYSYKIKLDLNEDMNLFELPRSLIPEFEDIHGNLVYTLRFSYSQTAQKLKLEM